MRTENYGAFLLYVYLQLPCFLMMFYFESLFSLLHTCWKHADKGIYFLPDTSILTQILQLLLNHIFVEEKLKKKRNRKRNNVIYAQKTGFASMF